MRNNARQTRENRTIPVDFPHEATSFQLRADGKAFGELGMGDENETGKIPESSPRPLPHRESRREPEVVRHGLWPLVDV
jgi:hypothetical protein